MVGLQHFNDASETFQYRFSEFRQSPPVGLLRNHPRDLDRILQCKSETRCARDRLASTLCSGMETRATLPLMAQIRHSWEICTEHRAEPDQVARRSSCVECACWQV